MEKQGPAQMECNVKRKHTVYTKDILPAHVTRRINNDPQTDLNGMVKKQLEKVQAMEKESKKLRYNVVGLLDENLHRDDYTSCVFFGYTFLQDMLAKVEEEEKALRNKILGQQECVEMFKEAVDGKEAADIHLENSRMQRDQLTSELFQVVNAREKLFNGLEVLRRSSLPLTTETNSGDKLAQLKYSYENLQDALKEEHSKLKMFTDWQRNPQAMQKQIKAINKNVAK